MRALNSWSVDNIRKLYDDPRLLVRVTRLSDSDRVQIRYLLVDHQCVHIREYSRNDKESLVSFGLSYIMNFDAIERAIQPAHYGSISRLVPVITPDNMRECLKRDFESEVKIHTEIDNCIQRATEIRGSETLGNIENKTQFMSEDVFCTVYNVGQGDAILLGLPGETAWLIDAYGGGKGGYTSFHGRLKSQLFKTKKQLKRMVISHLHYDHIRDAVKIIKDFQPNEVVVNDTMPLATASARNLFRECSKRGILRIMKGPVTEMFGTVRVCSLRTCDFPEKPILSLNPNDHAIALGVGTRDYRSLFPGDIPGTLLAALTKRAFLAGYGNKTFYKVTHHCSETGNDSAFFSYFPPKYAATSCGLGNPYGHPHSHPKFDIDFLCKSNGGEHQMTFIQKKDLDYKI